MAVDYLKQQNASKELFNWLGSDKISKIIELLDAVDVKKVKDILDSITIVDGKVVVNLEIRVKKE